MDHSHRPEAAMSDEADPLYRPMGGLEAWAAVPVDEGAWAEAVDRLQALRAEHPDWAAMVGRGALLAAAHQSGALDGLYPADQEVVLALLRGEAGLAPVDEHVRANYDALCLACDTDVSEESVRRIHEVACRPQATHRARVDDRVQDHVLAAGDYKHHPNHILAATGDWRATAPVTQVEPEMAALVERVTRPAFADLHPVAQAAYLHHALLHVAPFADGNGRVARALAGAFLLRAAGVPYLVWNDEAPTTPAASVDLVQRAGVALVDLLTSAPQEGTAVDRWRRRSEDGEALRCRLMVEVGLALDRHHQRPGTARRADLSAAEVVTGDPLVLRVPLGQGSVVEETVTIDPHRVDTDGPVLLTAVEAGLRLDADREVPLDGWLDRVVSVLALRVAAELEEGP